MGADPELSRLAPRMEKTVELIGEVGLPEWVDRYWSTNPPFAAASLERSPEILDEYRAMVLANDAQSYVRTCLAISRSETLTGELGAVTLPALVIAGSADDRTLPEAGRELSQKLGAASFVELPDVGHTMPLEAPDAVGTSIVDFLRSVSPRGRA
jgi:pimeloyl-ACP methyl ester carboxylesterase